MNSVPNEDDVTAQLEQIVARYLTNSEGGFNEVSKRFSDLKMEVSREVDALQKKYEEIDDLIRTSNEEAREAGDAYYGELVDLYKSRAKIWMWLTLGLAMAISTLTIVLYLFPNKDFTTITSLYVASLLAKVFIFSSAAFFLHFSSKNYFTARHNETIAMERRAAFQVYHDLAEKNMRDTTLAQCAAAYIFAMHPTGYFKGSHPKQHDFFAIGKGIAE